MPRNRTNGPGTPGARSSRIRFNPQRDLPVMLAIRNAIFIGAGQLWEHLQASGVADPNRQNFERRVIRLVRAGAAERLPPLFPYPGFVYTITRQGLSILEACGEGLVSLTSESGSLADRNQMQHFLELAEVRVALHRAGLLRDWTSDLEIRSINQSIDTPLAKDYDAIADLEWENKRYRVALEYERSRKSLDRYDEIVSAIAGEHQVHMILYLTSSIDLLYMLKAEFDRQDFPVALAPSHSFRLDPLTHRLFLTRSLGVQRATLPALLEMLPKDRNGKKPE
jgi:hypothetical protein